MSKEFPASFSLKHPRRLGLYLPPGESPIKTPSYTNDNLKRALPIIYLTKQEMDALNLLQNYFINKDGVFCFIGNHETVEQDTSYIGNVVKNQQVKHFSNESTHALGYKNYSELTPKLKSAVDLLNNLKIRGPVPNEDGKIVQMLHVVGCIKPNVSNTLIKDDYGMQVVFNFSNQNKVVRIYLWDSDDYDWDQNDPSVASQSIARDSMNGILPLGLF